MPVVNEPGDAVVRQEIAHAVKDAPTRLSYPAFPGFGRIFHTSVDAVRHLEITFHLAGFHDRGVWLKVQILPSIGDRENTLIHRVAGAEYPQVHANAKSYPELTPIYPPGICDQRKIPPAEEAEVDRLPFDDRAGASHSNVARGAPGGGFVQPAMQALYQAGLQYGEAPPAHLQFKFNKYNLRKNPGILTQ